MEQPVLDEANSTLCDGDYVDGNWMHTNPRCEDTITYKEAASASPYITVNVNPVSSSIEMAVADSGP